MFQTPTTRVWKQWHDEGKLTRAQDVFWNRKPPEELYDLQSDPDEINNLVVSQAHQEILEKLRNAQRSQAREIRDLGYLPEGELFSRSEAVSPYHMGHDDRKYPFGRVFETAELASMLKPNVVPDLKRRLNDSDSAVRYWAALGMLMRGTTGVETTRADLRSALQDSSPHVRIAAAETLGQYGSVADLEAALKVLVECGSVEKNGVFVSMAALNALDALGDKASSAVVGIKAMTANGKVPDPRYSSYVPRLLEDLQARFK
jgi:uncharacterized sulfatase